MPDIVDPQTRSRMMSGIRGKNTKPELLVRKGLHALGFRYRLHAADFPGRPDMLFPRYRAAVFVHGCFWHGHDCPLFRMPGSRQAFWAEKIRRNRERDEIVSEEIRQLGWRQLTIWECALRGPGRIGIPETIEKAGSWLISEDRLAELRSETL